jgi:ketosteroid isomerase-like protein
MMNNRNSDVTSQHLSTLSVIEQFNDAFNQQNIDAVMALMSDDCVFENTNPPPDGRRYSGREAVREAFLSFFESSPQAEFEVEELFVAGDRCVVRWLYRWSEDGHVRGVDLFRVREGRVLEKLSYVKG